AISGDGMRFKAKLDVVESMGSELYVYFEGGEVRQDQLDELAADTGAEEVPGAGSSVVARLDAASRAEAGAEVELVLDPSAIKLFDPASGAALR
ncbi:ABC transporter ATP-binding protein, partial [Solirubrobacter sp. CPCC 204708]|nr:ABC transporter ATP-binding protein [Solirubrobacter deserti]